MLRKKDGQGLRIGVFTIFQGWLRDISEETCMGSVSEEIEMVFSKSSEDIE